MPDISLALALLKKPIESVLAVASGKVKDEIAQLKAEGRIKAVYQKLNATQKVKTIWDVDRARSLSSFYYPAKIRNATGQRQQLSSLDELPGNAVVLSGTVGQGKSILLRYLLGREMKSGTRVPLFIELRKVPLQGLDAYLIQMFGELLEVQNRAEIYSLFAESGKISFLLDGFDEIDPDRATDLMTAIEHLASRFPQARIIVTSRPASGIETSPLFDVVHIAPLSDSDFSGFFNKILKDSQLATLITNAVAHSSSVKAVASTPLLATLLTIVYRSTQRIPADFSEFYEELFQILLVRHDRSKAFKRHRKTTLGDRELQQAFEAFCYKTHADGKSVIPKTRALEVSKVAIKSRELICREDDFLSDVVGVTCLLQEDGSNIEFVHQSVREFYAAKYVSSRPEEIAIKFYETLRKESNWRKWDQVANFLSQLDKYRISQFYLIPMGHAFLKAVKSDGAIAAPPRLRELMSEMGGVKKNEKLGDKQPKYVVYRSYPNDSPHWERFGANIYQLFYGPDGIAAHQWVSAFDDSTIGQARTFTEIAAHCGKLKELDEFLVTFVVSIKDDIQTWEKSAEIVDSSTEFMGL